MEKQDIVEISIDVSATDASAEEIDRMTRGLLQELKRSDAESVELIAGDAPDGTKSAEVASIGLIVVEGILPVLTAVIEFVKAWSALGSGRVVKFKGKVGGQAIEFEGNAKDLEKILARLDKRRKR